MRSPFRRFFFAEIIVLLAMTPGQCCWPQQSDAASASASDMWLGPEVTASLDTLFAVPQGSPGYAVAVIKDGRFAYKRGFGLANLDDNIPITPDTSFHLASLSKQFTAAAIALLILDHKIALTDPVSRYIPEAHPR